MSIVFVVREPGLAELRVPAEPGTTFGRHPRNTCVLRDPAVGTWQSRVAERDGQLVLEDMGGRNGTRVEDGPLLRQGQCAALREGLRFRLGGTVLEVSAGLGGDPAKDTEPRSHDDPGTDSPYLRTIVESEVRAGAAADASGRFDRILERLRPRLVVYDGPRSRIHDIEGTEVGIGRGDTEIRLENLSVSSLHARVAFDGKLGRFFLEDLESANGTFMTDGALAPGRRRELFPDTHLRFGEVDALWVSDSHGDEPVPPERRKRALSLVARDGDVSREQCRRAEADAVVQGRHPGEILVLRGLVSARAWASAHQRAGLLGSSDTIEIRRGWLVLALFLVAVAVTSILIFRGD